MSPTEEIDTKDYTEQQLRMLLWHYQQQGPTGAAVWRALRDALSDGDHDKAQTAAVTRDYRTIEGTVRRPADDGGVLTTSERRGMHGLVDRLVKAFPPADYLYASLGSSPALLTGLLQLTIDNAIVVDLPISNVGVPEIRDLKQGGWDNLCTYARTALKGRETRRAKIVVVDFIEEGRGVALAKAVLERLLPDKKPVRIFSLSSVSEDDVKSTPYLAFADITQVGELDEDESEVFKAIMSCQFKNTQLLRKYDTHDMTKIATGEIRAPRQDASKTFWLFQTLAHTVAWLDAQGLRAGGKASRENVDDFVGKAHQALEAILPIPQLRQLAPRLKVQEEKKSADVDADADLDVADRAQVPLHDEVAGRLAVVLDKWLEHRRRQTSRPRRS